MLLFKAHNLGVHLEWVYSKLLKVKTQYLCQLTVEKAVDFEGFVLQTFLTLVQHTISFQPISY